MNTNHSLKSSANEDVELQNSCDSPCDSVDGKVTLVEALMAKYDESQFQTDLSFFGARTSSKLQERAGNNQPVNFKERRVLSLDDCDISSAGAQGEISAVCPNLEELDLSKNVLKDWRELLSIMSELPRLKVLNCSCNNLEQDADVTAMLKEFPLECRSTLRKLALNNTNISLEIVFSLLECFICVEELFLSLNGYNNVPLPGKRFTSIKRLYLNNSEICDWAEINKIGQAFPSLEELVMTESLLENILPSPSSADCVFPNLKSLVLTRTMLNDWSDIEALNTYPSLKDVRLLGIPLLNDYSEKQGRQLLVANLPNIEMLNNSKILPKERDSADRMFIRKFMDSENPPERYKELVELHGHLERLADVNLAPKQTALVEIHYEDLPPFKREIKLNQTLFDFKKSLVDVVGVPPSGFRLFYHDFEAVEVFGPEELKSSLSKTCLHRFKVKDGDLFHIVRKDA